MTNPERSAAYREAIPATIAAQIDRYHQLDGWGVTSVEEHLELLGLGERIARYYSRPSRVDTALRAGATWTWIAWAIGTTPEAARAAYREWADGQHRMHAQMGIGLDDAEYAAALKRAEG